MVTLIFKVLHLLASQLSKYIFMCKAHQVGSHQVSSVLSSADVP